MSIPSIWSAFFSCSPPSLTRFLVVCFRHPGLPVPTRSWCAPLSALPHVPRERFCLAASARFVAHFFRGQALEDGLEKHPGNDELGKALEQYTALQKRFKASSGKGNDGKLEELMLEALKSKSNEAMELEKKLQMQGRQLQRVTADIKRDDRQSKLNMLTVKQLDELPAETKAYRSVGKMYLAQTMDEVKEGLQEDTVALEERKTQQMRKKEYLELQLKNSRNEMEDIYKALQKK